MVATQASQGQNKVTPTKQKTGAVESKSPAVTLVRSVRDAGLPFVGHVANSPRGREGSR